MFLDAYSDSNSVLLVNLGFCTYEIIERSVPVCGTLNIKTTTHAHTHNTYKWHHKQENIIILCMFTCHNVFDSPAQMITSQLRNVSLTKYHLFIKTDYMY